MTDTHLLECGHQSTLLDEEIYKLNPKLRIKNLQDLKTNLSYKINPGFTDLVTGLNTLLKNIYSTVWQKEK